MINFSEKNLITLKEWISFLLVLHPCEDAIVFGPQPSLARRLLPSAHFLTELVSGISGKYTYNTFNISSESGIIELNELSFAWPNLKLLRSEGVQAYTIQSLFDAHDFKNVNWLWINLLKSIEVLKGSGDYLSSCNVVFARIAVDEKAPIAIRLCELGKWMLTQGFIFVGVEVENNKLFGTALFLRNTNKSSALALEAEVTKRLCLELKLEKVKKSNELVIKIAKENILNAKALNKELQHYKKAYSDLILTQKSMLENEKVLGLELKSLKILNENISKSMTNLSFEINDRSNIIPSLRENVSAEMKLLSLVENQELKDKFLATKIQIEEIQSVICKIKKHLALEKSR